MQNFGKIKETFNSLLVEGIASKNSGHKAIFKEFIKLLKENQILRTQFNIYYNIEHKVETNEFKSSEYIKENISLMNSFKKEDIVNENKKLVSLLEKNDIPLTEGYANEELHKDISRLIFTSKNSQTIDTIVESLERVVGYVKANVITENTTKDIYPTSLMANAMVRKFNDKYKDLTPDVKEVVRTIVESDEEGKKRVFTSMVTECVDLVNLQLEGSNGELKEKLLQVKDALLRMEYSQDTYISNISRLIDLKN